MVWVLLVGLLEIMYSFLLQFDGHFLNFELSHWVNSLLVEVASQGKLFLFEIVGCLGLVIGRVYHGQI